MSLITTLATVVLMNPGNVATAVSASQLEMPGYDWKSQKVVSGKTQLSILPDTGLSIMGTKCQLTLGGPSTIDDWNSWD